MPNTIVQVKADEGEGTTGYTTFVTMGTSTSDLGEFSFVPWEWGTLGAPDAAMARQADDTAVFPELHEERFLDESLAEFYRRRGY